MTQQSSQLTFQVQKYTLCGQPKQYSGVNGFGKGYTCMDTPILLFNGSWKYCQHIAIGDELIGDDGDKRTVVNTSYGYGSIYKISSDRGEPYFVNEDHLLSVRMQDHNTIFWDNTNKAWRVLWLNKKEKRIVDHIISVEGLSDKATCPHCKLVMLQRSMRRHYSKQHKDQIYIPPPRKPPTLNGPESPESLYAYNKMLDYCKTHQEDNTLDISVKDYLNLTKTTQGRLSGFKGDCINWPYREIPLDPYVLGLWLGDGNQRGYSFASYYEQDPQTVDYLIEWGKRNDANITQSTTNKYEFFFSSIEHYGQSGCAPLKKHLDKYNLTNNKVIPYDYKINDRKTRLSVLAGIIDTDGHVYEDREGSRVVISQGLLHTDLARDIILLTRSLGFNCSWHYANTQWEHKGEINKGKCINMNISGKGLEDIPTLIPRKKCGSPLKRNLLNIGSLNVEKVSDNYYFGFQLDGNGRFLLADNTVTHDCNISTYNNF